MSNYSLAAIWRSRARAWTQWMSAKVRTSSAPTRDPEDRYLSAVHRLLAKRGLSENPSDDDVTEAGVEVLDLLLAKGVPAWRRTLLDDAPRIVRSRERLDRRFERRLHQRWGDALDHYHLIAIHLQEIGSYSYQQAVDRGSDDENSSALLEAVSGLHARGCRQALEVHRLLAGGFPRGAHVIARGMHEAAATVAVLTDFGRQDDYEDIGVRFLLFDYLTAAMDAEEYQEHADRLNVEPFTEQDMRSFEENRAEALKRFPDMDCKLGWARHLPGIVKGTFPELEQLAGIDHLRPYYTWASHEVHASPKGVRLNRSFLSASVGGAQIKLAGRTNVGLADPAQGALIALNHMTACLVGLLGVSPTCLVAAQAVAGLVEEALDAFASVELQIEAEEAAERAARGSDVEVDGAS